MASQGSMENIALALRHALRHAAGCMLLCVSVRTRKAPQWARSCVRRHRLQVTWLAAEDAHTLLWHLRPLGARTGAANSHSATRFRARVHAMCVRGVRGRRGRTSRRRSRSRRPARWGRGS